MNLMDIMMLLLLFEDSMKSGVPSMTKHASQKPSEQHFGGNQGNGSSGAVSMKLGHMKPQEKSKKDLSRVSCYNCSQVCHYTMNFP